MSGGSFPRFTTRRTTYVPVPSVFTSELADRCPTQLAQSLTARFSSKGVADVDVLAPLSEVALELVGRGVLGHSFADDKGKLSATLKDMLYVHVLTPIYVITLTPPITGQASLNTSFGGRSCALCVSFLGLGYYDGWSCSSKPILHSVSDATSIISLMSARPFSRTRRSS